MIEYVTKTLDGAEIFVEVFSNFFLRFYLNYSENCWESKTSSKNQLKFPFRKVGLCKLEQSSSQNRVHTQKQMHDQINIRSYRCFVQNVK